MNEFQNIDGAIMYEDKDNKCFVIEYWREDAKEGRQLVIEVFESKMDCMDEYIAIIQEMESEE